MVVEDSSTAPAEKNGSISTRFETKRSMNESITQLILDRYGFIQSVSNSTRLPRCRNSIVNDDNDEDPQGFPAQDDTSGNWWSANSQSPSSNTVRTIDSINSITDISALHRHELKWIDMFKNWPEFMDKRFHKVKLRCRKGIPPSVRGCAWRHLCGAVVLEDQQPDFYFELVKSDKGDPKVLAEIQKDLHRSFPNHELFYDEAMSNSGTTSASNVSLPRGQSDLFDLLKAYSLYNPSVGYCQALAPVASVLLMHLPAHQAFWVLVAMCQYYLDGYYSPGLCALKTDAGMLDRLFQKFSYKIYRLLHENGTEPVLFVTEWFLCVFSRSLPWASVLRVWDAFFCEGVKVLFRVAFIWVKLALDTKFRIKVQRTRRHKYTSERNISLENFTNGSGKQSSYDSIFTSCEQQADILSLIKNGPIHNLSAEDLMYQISKLPISDNDLYEANKYVLLHREDE